VTRIKWMFWKFCAWLTKPWHPKSNVPNPRDRKRRIEPLWYLVCLRLMYGVNAVTAWLIFASLAYLYLR
jgi:hypothetical protein